MTDPAYLWALGLVGGVLLVGVNGGEEEEEEEKEEEEGEEEEEDEEEERRRIDRSIIFLSRYKKR